MRNHNTRPNRNPILRSSALAALAAFVWTFVAAPVAMAATVKPAPAPVKRHFDLPAALKRAKQFEGKKIPTFDYAAAEAKREAVHKTVRPLDPNMPRTLLVDVPILCHKVVPWQIAAWKTALKTGTASKADAAWDHVWLGEWELAQNQQPETAIWHFEQAKKLSGKTDRVYGLATYDAALSVICEGAYAAAVQKFKPLATLHPMLVGYDPRRAICWLRHANACAAYHAERSRAGIPEPPRLDPLCAAAALATCLRAIGRPYDKATVLKACRVTGEGSNLQDVLNAAKKLGVQADAVTADDKGLISLPKPLVAFVEHDHFIAVIGADKSGVTYLCSDCGMWPGGAVHLSWKQWHMLEPGMYATVTNPASGAAAKVASIPLDSADPAASPLNSRFDRVATTGSLSGLLHSSRTVAAAHPLVRGHVFRTHVVHYHTCVGLPFTIICLLVQLCPKDGTVEPDCPSNGGPTSGDPVNLANGAEEYTPNADLTVANPGGPYVKWQRMYDSLRNWGASYAEGDTTYECSDFGNGWSQTYNEGVFSPDGGTDTSQKYVFMPDGSRVAFMPSAVPSASQTAVSCDVQPGFNLSVEWDYDAASGQNYFTVTNPDKSQWITTDVTPGNNCYRLAEIKDSVGHGIFFNYTDPDPVSGWPLLASITTGQGGTGTALLTVQRTADGTNSIASVTDCYGRSVYYNVQAYPDSIASQHLDHVSQVVTGHASAPPDRYAYGYQFFPFAGGGYVCSFLHTITVPSPTGSGASTATINYDPNSAFVLNRVDANGNTRTYTSVDQYGNPATDTNYTKVAITNSSGFLVDTYRASYDNSMNKTGMIDNAGNTVMTLAYADPNDAYKPSSVTDANGHTSSFTYDSQDNCASITDARGTVTQYSYDYSVDPKGIPTSMTRGSKQPVTMNIDPVTHTFLSVNVPQPGTVAGTQISTTGITLDAAGNPIIITTPGATTSSSYTETLNYTTDGGYTRSEGIHQPVTVTDNSGKVTHYRYDDHNRVSTMIDANGHETDVTYNVANQPTVVTFPATGQTGTGQSTAVYTYLYPGGPCSHVSVYDESGVMTRDVAYGHDLEGNTTSVTYGGVTSSVTYDADYRPMTVTDGNGHVTHYTYDAAGNLASASHPGAGTGSTDTLRYTSYDAAGDPLVAFDGRGVEADYTYNDPDNNLTDITFPSSSSSNIHYTYDSYGRLASITDSSSTRSITYDDDDYPLTVTTTYPGLPSGSRTFTLTYGYNPDGTRHSLTTPASTTAFIYGYDTSGRLNSVTNPLSQTTQWGYADNGWLQSQTYANGVTTGYLRNALGEMTELVTRKSDNTLLSDFNSMSYDAQGNLLSMTASIPASTSFSGVTSYTYDALDELTQEVSARSGGYTNNFAYDSHGNPTTFKGSSISYNSDDQVSGATYDGEGNPASYGGNALTLNATGDITSVGTTLTAGYFAGGQRAFKTSSSGSTYFLYDGDKPVCEIDGAGAITAVNTWGTNGLVSRDTSAGSAYYTFDPQGNVCQKLDGTGSPTLSTMFDAYGSPASTNSDPYNAPGAQFGNYRDAETGLVWMGHRYYDPTSGRFLTRDPAEEGTGTNEYAFANSNPITFNDPLGLDADYNPNATPANATAADWEHVGKVELAALVSVTTDGNYDGGIYRCDPGWDIAKLTMGWAWAGIDFFASDGMSLTDEGVGEIGECGIPGGGCFTAGTLVQMADGTTEPVEQVKTGDAVESRNEKSGKTEPEKVTATIKHYNVPTVTLTFSNSDQVVTTGVHPFYVQGKGFTLASDLAIGNAIVTRAGPSVTVTGIEQTAPETVYNLTVDGDHTYFVGSKDGGVWVHNSNPLECPVEGETFYRAMSQEHYDHLVATGEVLPTGETFTSPTQAFSDNYDGVVVKFDMQPGTMADLQSIGVRDTSAATTAAYPNMPQVFKGWDSDHVFFKGERPNINVGLGKGFGLDWFNSMIRGFQRVP